MMLRSTIQRNCCQHRWGRQGPCLLAQQRHVGVKASEEDRPTLMQRQRDTFTQPEVVSQFTVPLPQDIEQRLQQVAKAVPGLGPSSRVIDVGSGTGCLIPHIQARGVKDILAVDLSETMLKELSSKYCQVGALGNEIGVRTWCGDVVDLPAYQGPADAFFMNAVFGNLHSPRDALLKAALMLRPGGHVVVSHPLGREWQRQLHLQQPALVPHELPSRQALEQMVWDLPLRVVDMVDERDLYVASLQVPPGYALQQAPVYLDGPVVVGFGRGSRQMGTPTANIDPAPLAAKLQELPRGVYFGWARLEAPAGSPAADGAVHKMVMNIGKRPTASAGQPSEVSVEVHIMHQYAQDFYGARLRVVALGYLRPEMRFPGGIGELITRIRADVATARIQLDDPALVVYQKDSFLLS